MEQATEGPKEWKVASACDQRTLRREHQLLDGSSRPGQRFLVVVVERIPQKDVARAVAGSQQLSVRGKGQTEYQGRKSPVGANLVAGEGVPDFDELVVCGGQE